MKRFFYFSPMRIPQVLQKGDKIALIAPAKKIESNLEPSLEIIKSWGIEPILGENVLETNNYFAGTDEQRLSDLQWALDNPEIKAIIIARGGYGTTRIIDQLDWTSFDMNPKWICGFSDITSLLSLLNNRNVASIHGPMGVTLTWDEQSTVALQEILFKGKLEYQIAHNENNKFGKTRAPLVGGNLSIICNTIGTASEIQTEGKILFLEEVGEYLYHLDRMLIQLKRAGKLDSIKGLIVGDFSSMKDHQDSFGKGVEKIISESISHLDIPVAFGFPLGHESKNLPVICGIESRFEVNSNCCFLRCHV
ncbi:MAG: muramoyltetrapeptide carboxypeptidase [Roseivirga sp.]|jgi:muramoyltetrapeptide carboxypeptidase